MVNNKLPEVLNSINELLILLSCGKCNKKLFDPQQLLSCGHITCKTCKDVEIKCFQCTSKVARKNLHDEVVFKLLHIREVVLEKQKPIASSTTEEPSSSLSSTNKFNNSESRNNYHLTNGPIKCEEKNSSPNFKKRKVKSLYTSKSKLKAKTKKLNTDNSKKLPRDINKKSGTGETYLHHACIKNQVDRVEFLLSNNANPNTKDNADWTPLQESANYGFYEVCKLLLDNAAKIDDQGHKGRTALHDAVLENQSNVVKLLLQYSASQDILDDSHHRVLDYCRSDEIRNMLTSSKASKFRHENSNNLSTSNYSQRNEDNSPLGNGHHSGSELNEDSDDSVECLRNSDNEDIDIVN